MEGSKQQDLEKDLMEMLKVVVLPELSNANEQCIYRVPPRIRQSNPKAYTPRVISIGPFHKPQGSGLDYNYLKPMEDLKLKYLKGFLNRTNRSVVEFVAKLRELENRIRNCYSEPVHYNSNDFLKMILIDACFIIEYFLRTRESEKWNENDPLRLKRRIAEDIVYDFILIENQIPFFILEEIYNHACVKNEIPFFLEITFFYFQIFNPQGITHEVIVSPKHFTDLIRTFMMPSSLDSKLGEQVPRDEIKNLYSASQLREAGLVFDVSQSKCLLDLNFDGVKLKIPCLDVYEETETQVRNIIAFEQCHFLSTSTITQYIQILNFLIDTEKDVEILVNKKIIVNWMGDTKAVATMINNLTSDIVQYTFNSKYLDICNALNKLYENPCNQHKANLKHDYFNTPWKTASTAAASVLLLLTLIQTICSIISLFQGN